MASIFGAIVGAIAISVVNFLLHLVFAKQLFNDGLYGLLYIFFVPQGLWLGGFTGYSLAAAGCGRYRQAGVSLLVGSSVLVFVALLFALGYSHDQWDYLTGYFGVALVWTLGLIIRAIRLVNALRPAV